MSQPSNYQYQSYQEPANSLKGGPPLMVNGQPNSMQMQHTQNGVQPRSFNSAGTPSSQSSRDPSRETSRDPSPTQYLHNQYRPQLQRPPMPPINGQQPAISHVPTTLHPGVTQPRQSSPLGNPQNMSNQFIQMQSVNTSNFASSSSISNLQSSSQPASSAPHSFTMDSQLNAGIQSQKTVPGARYDFPSPNRNVSLIPGSQTIPDNQPRPGQIQLSAQNPGQNVPPGVPGLSSINQQPNIVTPNWSKDGSSSSSVPKNPNQQTTAVNPSQTWRNPVVDTSMNNSQTISQPYPGMLHQNSGAPPRTIGSSTGQNVNIGTPLIGGIATQNSPSANYMQQSQQSISANKTNAPTSVSSNIRGPQPIGTQAISPIVPGINSSMQNVFGNTQINQHPSVTNQSSLSGSQKLSGPQMPQVSLPKPQAQYPPTQQNITTYGSQPNLSGGPLVPTGPSQSNQSAYGSQQNLASQRKYPQPGYGVPMNATGPNIAGPPLGPPKPPGISATGPGQVPMRPSTTAGPPPPLPGQQSQTQYDNRTPYFGQMSNVPLDNMAKRYPTTSWPDQMNQLNTQVGNLNVTQAGFNELWGQQSVDLLQCRNLLPPEKVEPPKIKLNQEFFDSVNCSPDIFRCTVTKIPESNSLLQKCRLPLGVLIHPFKDLNHLPVIQCSTIVRCRACRTYINPFVYFVDSKRWKCNLCYRVNELPEEFQFDPVTKSYGDPSRRPEVKTSTIEFIAPSEYMLRPPQPAVYLFLLDVSRLAVETGYLTVVCETIAVELTKLPGDGRTQVGFMAIDSAIHFFSMPDNVSQPHELIMLDVDDVFLPCPDNLIVNLKEREELIRDLLAQLPTKFNGTHDTNSALGAGLQAAFKLMSPTGGRVTVFQTCLPNLGPGALLPREDPNTRASKDVPHLNPATDFYKRLALDCSGQQIAVDLFLLNSQYSDLATLSGMCKFSGGCMYHIPLFRTNKPQHSEMLERMLRRYLTRKIGFEAVMRIRCTRGLSIHTFHGNFFVRSTDLLSLPNVNPDAGFGMQVSVEENLSDTQTVCFQAALLYTSSKGERRIRVHTLCLPVSSSMTDILFSADQQSIIGLLSKMAVDRSQQSSLSDARDALINVAIDVLSAYKLSQSSSTGGLLAPENLKLLPLYIIALIKCIAFRSGASTRLDDRVYAMCQMKALPLGQLMQMVYPDLYPVDALDDHNSKDIDGKVCPQPPRIHLSAEKLDFRGVFLMDAGDRIFVYVGKNVDPLFCSNVLGVQAFAAIPEEFYELPELETVESERLRNFVFSLQEEKPYYAPLQVIRDDSHFRSLFTDRLIEDRFESALSYYEFLQHLKTQVK